MDCPVCLSDELTKLRHPNNYEVSITQPSFGTIILECLNCNFVFSDFIHPKIFEFFYKHICRSSASPEDFIRLRAGAKKSGESQLTTIKPFLSDTLGRVFDYGGGSGEAARLFLPFASEVYISEMDPKTIAHIREEPRLNLIEKNELLKDDYMNFFDLIIFSNVLEHMSHPFSVLEELSKLLVRDGKLIIEIPNEEPFIRETGIMMPQHVGFYSLKTFEHLIKRQGSFEIEDIRTCGPKVDDMIKQKKLLHDFDAQLTPGGWVIRALLKNTRPAKSVSSQSFRQEELAKFL